MDTDSERPQAAVTEDAVPIEILALAPCTEAVFMCHD